MQTPTWHGVCRTHSLMKTSSSEWLWVVPQVNSSCLEVEVTWSWNVTSWNFCTILPSQQGTFPTSPLHSPVSPLLPCTALIKACFFISLELMLSPSSKRLRQWGEGSIKLIKVMSKLGFKPCQPGALGYSLIKHSTHPAQLSSNYHLNPVALLTVLIQIVRPCPCPLICC